MQAKPWNIHIVHGVGRIQRNQLHAQPPGMGRLHTRGFACFKKTAQTFVPKRLDHLVNLPCCAPRNTGITDHRAVGCFAHQVSITHVSPGEYGGTTAGRARCQASYTMRCVGAVHCGIR